MGKANGAAATQSRREPRGIGKRCIQILLLTEALAVTQTQTLVDRSMLCYVVYKSPNRTAPKRTSHACMPRDAPNHDLQVRSYNDMAVKQEARAKEEAQEEEYARDMCQMSLCTHRISAAIKTLPTLL